MERKEMEDTERRAGLDSHERDAAPTTEDAHGGGTEELAGADPGTPVRPDELWAPGGEDAPDERVVGSPWWERGPTVSEAPENAPDTHSGAGYVYRGLRYGEAAPEMESEALEEPGGDDDPVDPAVLAAMSDDRPADPAAEEGAAGEPAPEPAWWEGGPMPEEAAEDEPVAEAGEESSDAAPAPGDSGFASEGVQYGEAAPGPRSQPAEGPDGDDDPADTPVPAGVSEEQPPISAADAGEERAPVVQSPWWERASAADETSGEDPDSAELEPGVPYLYSGMGYGESVAEAQSQPPEEFNDDEPEDATVPAAASEDQPGIPAAEGTERHAGEEPPADLEAPHWQPPASPADLSGATETLPEGSPDELIRSIVADICPGELLLIGTLQPPLPEWAGAAVTALRNELDRRLAERNPGDASEYLRLAIVENAMGLHEEADVHLKEALPRSDRFGPVLNALAVTSLARGRVAPAIVYCKEALRETGGDDFVRAAASSNLGELFDLQGDAARATEAYGTAIDCLQAQGDTPWLSRLHLRVGHLYRRMGQADEARLHFSDSVRLFKDSGDQAGHVQSLAALGSSLTESGLHDLALRSFEEAVRICLRTADKPGAALVQDELGVAYMAQDQLTRALAYFESALSLHRELGNRGNEAATLNNIGKIHDSRGDVDEARRFYEAAVKINGAPGHDAGETTGEPQIDGGDQEAARAKLMKAEEIFSRAGSAEQQEEARQKKPY